LRELTGKSQALQLLTTVGVLSPSWELLLKVWVSLHKMSTHDVELQHAQNKQATNMLNQWETLAARSVIRNARGHCQQAFDVARARAQAHGAADPGPGSESEASCIQPASRARAYKSGLQMYHKVCSKRDAENGFLKQRGMRPLSRPYWAIVKDEWQGLNVAERTHYENMVQDI
jgi:hypothetical protein